VTQFVVIAFRLQMKQQLHYVRYRMRASASTDASDKAKCIGQESRYSVSCSYDTFLNHFCGLFVCCCTKS